MSIDTLKKKTISKFNLSGRKGKYPFIVNDKSFNIVNDTEITTNRNYKPITTSTVGFSINGKHS